MTRAVGSFWRKAYEENVTGMAAMVAYNLLLSLFPLALIALYIAGHVLSSPEVETSVVADLQQVFPSETEATLLDVLRRVRESSTTVGIAAIAASLWIGASFWGALDTAFCRIYHRTCRSWVRQKVFALGMLVVVLLFFGATVAVPTLQGLLVTASRGPAARARPGARARGRGVARRRPGAPVRRAVPDLLARAARARAVARRSGRARSGRRSPWRWSTTRSRSTCPT